MVDIIKEKFRAYLNNELSLHDLYQFIWVDFYVHELDNWDPCDMPLEADIASGFLLKCWEWQDFLSQSEDGEEWVREYCLLFVE